MCGHSPLPQSRLASASAYLSHAPHLSLIHISAFARAADSFVQNGAATLAACVVFFVIVPLAIYCLSYIPYLSAYGEVKLNLKTFERIWNAQVTMFEYHKNLVATHYFSSPWYEWPLIIKPMWYYSAAFPAMGKASTIMALSLIHI